MILYNMKKHSKWILYENCFLPLNFSYFLSQLSFQSAATKKSVMEIKQIVAETQNHIYFASEVPVLW